MKSDICLLLASASMTNFVEVGQRTTSSATPDATLTNWVKSFASARFGIGEP